MEILNALRALPLRMRGDAGLSAVGMILALAAIGLIVVAAVVAFVIPN